MNLKGEAGAIWPCRAHGPVRPSLLLSWASWPQRPGRGWRAGRSSCEPNAGTDLRSSQPASFVETVPRPRDDLPQAPSAMTPWVIPDQGVAAPTRRERRPPRNPHLTFLEGLAGPAHVAVPNQNLRKAFLSRRRRIPQARLMGDLSSPCGKVLMKLNAGAKVSWPRNLPPTGAWSAVPIRRSRSMLTNNGSHSAERQQAAAQQPRGPPQGS